MKRRSTLKRQSKRKRNMRTRSKRGGNKVQCCMCERRVSDENTLKPSACLMKHGSKAHRICKDCWWDPEKGFAREGVNHECPGCKKGLPLLKPKSASKVTEVIDLTADS
jgi:hypothetical protein